MGEESEKRFEAIMNKLFHSPPKTKSTNNSSRDVLQITRGLKRPRSSSFGMNLTGNVADESLSLLSGSATSAQVPLCRPWEREDLFRRLSTFKSMSWFAKPQVVSPLACALRGWVNVDMDTIGCLSCGARILFSTPSTWSQKQVEKAAMVFSLKLENGHKLLCPWINNACSEELAQFPKVSRAGLIEDFKKRLVALLQLTALPVISPACIDKIESPELEQFLRGFAISGYHVLVENSGSKLPGNVPELVSSFSYYQVLNLISLCGWEPHVLPYIVDVQDGEKQSIKDTKAVITKRQKQKVDVFSLCFSDGRQNSVDLQFDPSSVVLDCKFCGASVGLWAFSTVSRPVEYLRFVGVTEINGRNNAAHDEVRALKISSANEDTHTGIGETVKTTVSGSSASLDFTIAGGPPPAMLNYSATISLPIIGESLIAKSLLQTKPKGKTLDVEAPQQMSTESAIVPFEGTSQMIGTDFNHQEPLETPQAVSETSTLSEKLNDAERTLTLAVADHHRLDEPELSCAAGDDTILSRSGATESNTEKAVVGADDCEPDSTASNKGSFWSCKLVSLVPGMDQNQQSTLKSMEFDPIQQHRHFCPWIVSTGKTAGGWKETLSALRGHKEFSFSSVNSLPSSSVIEVDDPVASVEKLLNAKRTKLSGGS